MKLPLQAPQKKKLQATVARRPREADFTDETHVKLSSAFIVVLVLHIVAVGGIYAFQAIKAHEPPALEETESAPAPPPAQPVAGTQTNLPAAPAAPVATPAAPIYYIVKSGDTIAKIAAAYGVSGVDIITLNDIKPPGIRVNQSLKLPPGASTGDGPARPVIALKDSGVTYTVVHGDTPLSIARKLHVAYDDLIRLNNIEDPRKLKVGAKLKIPAKRSTV